MSAINCCYNSSSFWLNPHKKQFAYQSSPSIKSSGKQTTRNCGRSTIKPLLVYLNSQKKKKERKKEKKKEARNRRKRKHKKKKHVCTGFGWVGSREKILDQNSCAVWCKKLSGKESKGYKEHSKGCQHPRIPSYFSPIHLCHNCDNHFYCQI